MPKKAVLSAAVTGLVAQTLPALAVVRATSQREPTQRESCKKQSRKVHAPDHPSLSIAQVDERLNGDGTGLILGINDELLGFILLTIPAVIFSQFFYAQKDEGIAAGGEDDDSGLSL